MDDNGFVLGFFFSSLNPVLTAHPCPQTLFPLDWDMHVAQWNTELVCSLAIEVEPCSVRLGVVLMCWAHSLFNIHSVNSEWPHRKPRINSQLVAQQVAQQYATPPPAKKEKKEKPERPEKERADGERPERNLPDGEHPAKDKIEKDHADKEKKDREKEITVTLPKKPSSKKTRYGTLLSAHYCINMNLFLMHINCSLSSLCRPKMDNHQSPPSERNSIQSGKSTTKTKNSHISRCFSFHL